ncbi:hypothetical protein [Candidatus Marinarcus aquaticus]|uniref:Lipoprotein n=1 Tax=Candidatus Marinarcus aquaticus TaxID=2044504 RepID=A0A4V1LP65_9BACT|nr:hypothetical protein [Candidatus Marinarcus aquaticus]RXJ60118.1 hypothetical protein CRV04_03700 [Candidatus Marinarcus aquaticus]
MLRRYGLLFIVSMVTVLIQGCGSQGSYSDFNPKEVVFEEIKVEVASNDLTKKAELEKLLEEGTFADIPKEIDAAKAMRYQLFSAIDAKITHLNETQKKLELGLQKLNSEKPFAFSNYSVSETYFPAEYFTIGENKLYGFSDNAITVIDKDRLKEIQTIKVNNIGSIQKVLMNKDKIFVASYKNYERKGYDDTLQVFSKKTHKRVQGRLENSSIYDMKLVNDKLYYYIFDTVVVRDTKNLKSLKRLSKRSTDELIVSDKYLIVLNELRLEVYDSNTMNLLYKVRRPFKERVTDSTLIGDKLFLSTSNQKSIQVFDLVQKKITDRVKLESQVYKLERVNQFILYRSAKNKLSLLDSKTLKSIPILKTKKNIATFFANANELYIGDRIQLTKYNFKEITDNLEKLQEYMTQKSFFENSLNDVVALKAYLENLKTSRDNQSFLKLAGLTMKQNFKHGTIGERYVPYTSTSYSSPQHTTTYINGKAYNQTKYEDKSYSSGGYDEKVYGYKAIYRIDNTSKNYYYVKLKQEWTGKYSKYEVYDKGGAWSSESGSESKLVSKRRSSTHEEEFVLAPEDNFKFQFEVGEDEPRIDLAVVEIKVIPQEYYEALDHALDVKNEELSLLDKFLEDEKLVNWKPKILSVKQDIVKVINKRFNEANIKNAEVELTFDEKTYDKDFNSVVTLKASSNEPMCIYVDTPFGDKVLNTYEGKETGALFWKGYEISKNYTIQGHAKERLKVSVEKVAKICN